MSRASRLRWAVVIALVCATVCADDVALPVLPDEFSVGIEANFLERNATMEIFEYYDVTGDRARVENHEEGNFRISIYIYGNERHYNITNYGCNVLNATASPGRGGGGGFFGGNDGHLRRASDVYEDTKDLNYTYLGTESVRGILCDHWQASDVRNFTGRNGTIGVTNYTMDWYFTTADWSLRRNAAGVQVPVRTIVDGTNTVGGNSHSFNHYYEWTDFTPGPPDPSVFFIPRNEFCPELVQQPIPGLPDSWQTVIEANDVVRNISYEFEEYYDYKANKVKIVYSVSDKSMSTLYDIGKNKTYIITQEPSKCTVQPIPSRASFYNYTSHHLRHAYPGDDYEGLSVTYVYGGQTRLRNMWCDWWRAEFNGTLPNAPGVAFDYVEDWYFVIPQWDYVGTGGSRVPIASFYQGSRKNLSTNDVEYFNIEHHYTSTSFGPVEPIEFVVRKPCPGGRSTIELVLPKTQKFRDNVSDATTGAVLVFCVAVGLILGVVLHVLYMKRNIVHYRMDQKESDTVALETTADSSM